MLHFSHKQTTAYHPESNGAVERLHCCLKDGLRTRATTANWSEELPFVLLGLQAQPREDTGLSPAEAVFGTPSTGPAAELSGRFPPPLLAGGGMGTPPVHWQAGGGDLYI
jgi:hypothetical protein